LRLGVSTFSFANEWLTRRLTLEELLERLAESGLGPAIEVIGYQVWRGYPALGRGEVLGFRRLVDRLGLQPAALGAYVDLLRRSERALTTDEAVELLSAQVELARALGFPILRLHAGIPGVVLERAASAAERAGVVLATEIQGGQTPDDPGVATVIECYERVGSEAIALTLDFSVAMREIPTAFIEAVLRAGMTADQLGEVVTLWERGAATHELFAALAETGAPAAALDEARSGFVRFGRQDPWAWLPLVPRVAYTHAKFWELDDFGDEPTVRNAELVSMLRDGGYTGVVCSEWGGSAWLEPADVDAFALSRHHHTLLETLVAQPATMPAASS
jgi:hypothetical protein